MNAPGTTLQTITGGQLDRAAIGQSDEDFRRAVTVYPNDPRALANEMFWARGALPKALKWKLYTALLDLAVIVEVSRDPQGELGLRDGGPIQPSTTEGDAVPGTEDPS